MPTAWPHRVLRGLAAGTAGVKKSRKAVGPSEGKTKGVWETIATPARIAMLRNPLINTNRAGPKRAGKRRPWSVFRATLVPNIPILLRNLRRPPAVLWPPRAARLAPRRQCRTCSDAQSALVLHRSSWLSPANLGLFHGHLKVSSLPMLDCRPEEGETDRGALLVRHSDIAKVHARHRVRGRCVLDL